jgi:hypothetical protein
MITLRYRTPVAFFAGMTLTIVAAVAFQAWRADAAPGDTDTTFVPITPCRLLDTREPAWNIWGPNVTQSLPVHGVHGLCTIPTDAVGLSMNVTAVQATEPTFLTIWPDDQPMPNASSLNPLPGQPATPNAVTTELAPNGRFRVYNLAGHVHVIIDINGYYTKTTLQELDARLSALEAAGPFVEPMFAVVAANGTLTTGSRVVSVTKPGIGTYSVKFDRNVVGCAYTATIGDANGQAAGVIDSIRPAVDTVLVITQANDGSPPLPEDRAFHLVVTC